MFPKFIAKVIIFYLIINGIVYYFSDYAIFLPPKSSYTYLSNMVQLKTKNGKNISAVYIPNSTVKYVILYSHGNDEDLGHIMPTLRTFYSWGFGVMAYDYEGYGTSEGTVGEYTTYADIEAAYNFLVKNKKIAPQHIILFGRSVGSGPTVELATEEPVGGVILESAFISTFRVVTKYPIFIFDKFANLRKINKISAPLLVIHGMQDEIIPFWHGHKLYETYKGNKEYCWAEGVGHNDISITNWKIKRSILNFVQNLKQTHD